MRTKLRLSSRVVFRRRVLETKTSGSTARGPVSSTLRIRISEVEPLEMSPSYSCTAVLSGEGDRTVDGRRKCSPGSTGRYASTTVGSSRPMWSELFQVSGGFDQQSRCQLTLAKCECLKETGAEYRPKDTESLPRVPYSDRLQTLQWLDRVQDRRFRAFSGSLTRCRNRRLRSKDVV